MIHHISIAATQPLQVAQVLAELCQGKAIPFPFHEGSYIALPLDAYGTMIEVLPRGTELVPGSDNVTIFENSTPNTSLYSAFHAAISTPVSEAEILAIAAREGWQAARCDREGFFEVIECWIENQQLLEFLPPTLAERYLAFTQPQNLQQFLASPLPNQNVGAS
jgi:hypothetical protein